ncbi:type II toxin-antitoxin system Phd/YefM family antitoxin [Amycolatopsis taiwanensis]|uniref:type II toxin-antitoxin system Phd/YefM family antitoxin n=1 Tax=Amycolatopsis taiwanensis TaxID=342230 RepID=UPI0004ACF343|nr:type II toxin-antitoxin system prevent-host-death family antitoxin [Amycolatopsis taiwanensis]
MDEPNLRPDIAWPAVAIEVGIRSLRNHLSRYLDEVKEGKAVTVTEHGRPIARIVPIEQARSTLEELIAQGVVTPARKAGEALPEPIHGAGPVSDLVAGQCR